MSSRAKRKWQPTRRNLYRPKLHVLARVSPLEPSSRLRQSPTPSTSNPTSAAYTSTLSYTKVTSSGASISSRSSLSSLHELISENPHIYEITEIRAATNNFLAEHSSSSTSSTAACWRCNLRGCNTVVFQRKLRRKIQTSQLKEQLSIICRSHHMSIIKLLGASISGNHIYLVYVFIEGSNLVECLKNPRNPSFTFYRLGFRECRLPLTSLTASIMFTTIPD